MNAFIVGRAALKAGEGFGPSQESTNETVFNAARSDAKLYVEAGIAAAALHYLNEAIADITDEDKLHHLSEALAFIYSLSFNSEGRLTATEAHNALIALGWSNSDSSLNGIYNINLWEVTDQQMESAKDILDNSFPRFGDIPFLTTLSIKKPTMTSQRKHRTFTFYILIIVLLACNTKSMIHARKKQITLIY